MTGLLLQVRFFSSRLPGKMLLRLGGKTIIERCIERCRQINADKYIICTEPKTLPYLNGLDLKDFEIFAGSEDDVLGRFIECAQKYNIDTIIRATGDNPFVDYEIVNWVLKWGIGDAIDYIPLTGLPKGLGAEIVKTEALIKSNEAYISLEEREHVTLYIKRSPEKFRISNLEIVSSDSVNYSIDTLEDYNRAQAVFDE